MQLPVLDIANDEPRAPYMRVEKKGSPTVRQLIEAARGLHPGPKKVLAEICNLHEEGGRECYDANNNHLAKKLGMTVPMVSRHIHSLAERGLILLSPKKNGQKRTLTPDASLQAAYRSGESGKITEVVKSIIESGKITSWEDESGKKEFTEVVNKNYQFGKHNRSLIKEKNINCSYVVELEKQVADLREELNAANAACQVRVAEVLALSTANAALEKRLAEKAKRPVKAMAPIAERFAQDAVQQGEEGQARWARFCKWESEFPLPNVYAMRDPLRPAELTKLVDEFGGGEVKDMLLEMENYADIDKKKSAYLTAHTWLKRGRKRQEDEDARREAATARYRLTNPTR